MKSYSEDRFRILFPRAADILEGAEAFENSLMLDTGDGLRARYQVPSEETARAVRPDLTGEDEAHLASAATKLFDGDMHLVHIEGENQLADAMTKMDVSIDYIGRLVHDRNDFFEGRATPIRDEHQKVRYQKTSLITKPVMYFRYLHPDYKTVPLLIDMEWLAEHGCELGTLFHYGSEVVRQFIPDAHSAHPAVAAHQTSLIYRLVNNDKPEQIITIPIHLDKHLFRQHGINEITILSTIAEQINDYKYLFENQDAELSSNRSEALFGINLPFKIKKIGEIGRAHV
jgi:hypothetical protein